MLGRGKLMKVIATKIEIKERKVSKEMKNVSRSKENTSDALVSLCYLLFKEAILSSYRHE